MRKIARDDVLNIIKGLDLDVNIEELEPDKELNLQGIDSLDMMNIFFALEEKFSIDIEDEELQENGWKTIDEIVENTNKLLDQA